MRMRKVSVMALVFVAGLTGAPAGAQPVPVGVEFMANTYYTGAQRRPAVAQHTDGSFVVVWDSAGQDGDFEGIFGQRFDTDGDVLGTEFAVNTYTPLRQEAPAAAATSGGGFVVVWQSNGQDGNGTGIFGQRFSNAGAPAGTEFQVSSYFTGYQGYPAVASLDSGFVVVWESPAQDGSGSGIFGQRFAADATPAGTEFRVNQVTSAGQYRGRVAAEGNSFVVVWHSDGQDGDGQSIVGRRFDGTGSLGGDFIVNTQTAGDQTNPDVAVASSGAFMVAWQSYGIDSAGFGIAARRYSSAGAASGTEFVVNTYAFNDQIYPRLADDSLGGFVVAWETQGLDGDADSVVAQQIDSAGAPAGTEFAVNTFAAGAQRRPAISSGGDSPFVIVWQSFGQDGDLEGVFGQSYFDSAPTCGDAVTDGSVTATDALAILNSAVGIFPCLLCVCDVNNNGTVTATDALIVLRKAAGQAVILNCPAAC